MRHILSLSFLFATTLALAAAPQQPQQTQPPQQPGMRQGGRGGPMGSPLVTALDADRDGVIAAAEIDAAPAALKVIDRNGDGRVDRAELMPMGRGREGGGEGREGGRGGRGGEAGETGAASATELVNTLMAYDANKDGVLMKAELPERMQPIFDKSDVNKDGKLTADEIRKSAAAAPPTSAMSGRGERDDDDREERPPVDLLFTALDANHDGALQAAEIAAAPASLRTLDKNKDGRLTVDEYRQTGRVG